MGYFNYFIKCIIRNISYRLCKPKVLFTILLAFCILFGMKHFGFCALSDLDYEMIADGFSTITSNQGTLISQLSSIGVNVSDIENELNSINSDLDNIISNTSNIDDNLLTLLNRVNSLNTNILNIYNRLDSNQRELLSTLNTNNNNLINKLETENQKVLEELQQLRDALVGSESTSVSVNNLGSGSVNLNGTNTPGLLRFKIPMEYKYTYKINVTYKNTSSSNKYIFYFFYDKNVTDPSELIPLDPIYAGRLDPNISRTFTITTRDYQNPYLYLWYDIYFQDISVTASIEGLSDTMTENNQLQQESNQLQQEQNDILTNDDVNTDDLQFAQDDTINPTTDGFNSIFNTIYNAFCNTSSKPLTVSLPYINKSFTIQPNLVSNSMQKAGLGVVVTLINSFYYYSVCLYIFKDISHIIDNLKSGNITSDCGNVKTEVL